MNTEYQTVPFTQKKNIYQISVKVGYANNIFRNKFLIWETLILL